MKPGSDTERPRRRPWWRNEWLIMLAVLAVLHATGTLVHVQAFLQRGTLATGLFSADLTPEADRPPLPEGITFASSLSLSTKSRIGDLLTPGDQGIPSPSTGRGAVFRIQPTAGCCQRPS